MTHDTDVKAFISNIKRAVAASILWRVFWSILVYSSKIIRYVL